MLRVVFIALIVALPTAAICQTVDTGLRPSTVHLPLPGQTKTISVGSVLHEYGQFAVADVAVIDQEMKGGQWIIPLTVSPSEPLYSVSTKVKFKACTNLGNGLCGLDDDGDGTFDRMAKDSISTALKLKVPVKYRVEKRPIEIPNTFKQVIIYAGSTGDTLRLSYREFKDNFARPAFTEELVIPISKIFPQDIAVKELRARLHGIDGLGLRYEILAQ